MEMTRSMLAGNGLPQKFWGETLSTAVYLWNYSPTKAVKSMTPFEAFHGKKPDVGHLRSFGCVCYVHIAKDERKKLDVVARHCVLVGYGSEVRCSLVGMSDLMSQRLVLRILMWLSLLSWRLMILHTLEVR